ncbi:adenylate/guanylate cyclase domain-containing protein [Spirochaetia bacterium]|nr:adenylate/guanylate cyclase domain-containing protein [Spirochaetia bacterium]
MGRQKKKRKEAEERWLAEKQRRAAAKQRKAAAEQRKAAAAEQRRAAAEQKKAIAEQRKAAIAGQRKAAVEQPQAAVEQKKATAEQRRAAAEQPQAAVEQKKATAEQRRAAAEQPQAPKWGLLNAARQVRAERSGGQAGLSQRNLSQADQGSPDRGPKRHWFPRSTRVQYPIGIKLVIIITCLLLVSLGSITVLVSYMVSLDLRITAEDANFTVNRRSAAEADHALQTIRSNVLQLLDSLNAAEMTSDLARRLPAIYFERNQDVATVVIGSNPPLVNERFFLSNEIDTALVGIFMTASAAQVERARRGEPVLLNATPVFRVPLMALILPRNNPGGDRGTVTVIFSSEYIADSFGDSVNTSFMINHEGDILVHGDQDLVMAGANSSGDPLVILLFESRKPNYQTRYTDKAGIEYFGAFHKLSIADAAVITLAEYKVVFEGIAATTRRNIYLTAAVLFIAILFIWFFSRTISSPLKQLTDAAGKIELGQFELTLAETGRDEIGLLSESFVKMGNALVNFSRFTNVEVAMRAMRGELPLGGETKQATILFTDIRSFTSMSEKLEPSEVVEFLNDYMTRMVACVNQTKGAVDKFMGDAVMAHWGAVTTAGSPAADALNAVRTALAMRIALRNFNAGRDGSVKQPRIRIGCGISSGPIVAGQIGSQERMEYTVIGDAVNLASRLEDLNKSLGTDILITEETWKLVGGFLITEKMPMVRVKGKEKPVRIFAVINLRSRNPAEQRRPLTLREVRALMGIPAQNLPAAHER